MAQPETVLVGQVTRALERIGCLVVKQHGSAYSSKGFPDLVVVRPGGLTIFLEVKLPGRSDGPAGNGLSAAQVSWARRLALVDAPWAMVTSADEALDAVRAAKLRRREVGE